MRPVMVLSAVVCAVAIAPAQDDARPASTNVRGAEYPRVHTDARVTFRLKAPAAQKVQVQPGGADNGLGKGPFDMAKGADGVWTVTTPPAVPGFHYYWLLVDGVAVNDPGSETFFGWGKQTSGVEIPEKGTDFYDVKDVPHGQVRAYWYHSKVAGSPRRAFVYCPPGYDANPTRRYPVLYLQHGAGEDERGWVSQGRANFILDNLLAAGKARPMLVVMDWGYAAKAGAKAPPDAFEEVVLNDLIPGVDAAFRTLADRDHRAIAGLSMGAGQALRIGLTHPDTFSYVGAFSGAGRMFDVRTAYGGVFADAAAFNRRVRLLWIGAGTGEEAFHTSARAMHGELDRAGIRSVFVEQQGTAHEWQTWRKALYDFAPRLFND
ncbi:esterase [bacterium]|nr:esterase [bacterium]